MNAIRKILMPLLAVPLGMFIYVFTHPDWQWESPGLEYLFMVVGIPILIINFVAWFYPEIIKAYFPVKDQWGETKSKPVTLAIVISALIAVTCISVGAVSSTTKVRDRATFKSSVLQPTVMPAFTRSIQMYSDHPDSGESDTFIVPSPLPKTDIPPEQTLQSPEAKTIPKQTPQIPVSGGVPTSSATLSATQTGAASAAIQPTSTVGSSALCTPATPAYLDTILQSVQDVDPDNKVIAGWAVQSKDAANLWFVAAKISGPQIDNGATLPGVWALFDHSSEGYFDIYSINDSAMEFSGADWGEDSDPVLTMQSNGAQAAYDCATHAK